MDNWVIFLVDRGTPLNHNGSIQEHNGVFYFYNSEDKVNYMIPVRQVKYIRRDNLNET